MKGSSVEASSLFETGVTVSVNLSYKASALTSSVNEVSSVSMGPVCRTCLRKAVGVLWKSLEEGK